MQASPPSGALRRQLCGFGNPSANIYWCSGAVKAHGSSGPASDILPYRQQKATCKRRGAHRILRSCTCAVRGPNGRTLLYVITVQEDQIIADPRSRTRAWSTLDCIGYLAWSLQKTFRWLYRSRQASFAFPGGLMYIHYSEETQTTAIATLTRRLRNKGFANLAP